MYEKIYYLFLLVYFCKYTENICSDELDNDTINIIITQVPFTNLKKKIE